MATSNARSSEAASCPDGWCTTTIGEVADIFSGATPSTETASYWDGEIPWCIPTDITGTPGKYLLATERSITSEGLVSSGASLLPAGSLLLCSRATIGDVKIAATTICTNQGFKSLVCKEGVSNEFLYYLIQPFKPRMLELATGSTFRELSKHDLGNIVITLPPLLEQRTIAAVLSDIDGLLDALDALIAKKQAIKQATMQQLLTGKTRLPGFSGEWKTKWLGELVTAQQGGTPSKDRKEYWGGHFPFVTAADLTGFLTGAENARSFLTIQGLDSGAAAICEPGLLLLATRTGVGKVSIAGELMGASQDITVLAPNGLVDTTFLYWSLKHSATHLQENTRGTSIQGVTREDVDFLPIIFPPISEQRGIAAVLSDMDAEIAALQERQDKTRALKQGMMQKLLTGKFRLDQYNLQISGAPEC